ncbi:MAG TPA: DUF63 family protein [Methanomicrobiales archaeon]|jgi:uncharacterized membrane protein|nr:DUF63 family protein [Methanomicrobiales archaeon]
MISDFIYKYYIDPIRLGQPYNVVDTLTYALILVISVYLVYRWLKRSGISLDGEFILATIPYVVLGGLLRVVEDTGMINSDLRYLLITPLIFFVVFFIAAGALVLSRALEKRHFVPRFLAFYGGAGAGLSVAVALLLGWFGLTRATIDLMVLGSILLIASVSSLAVMFLLERVLRWAYAADPLYRILVIGQMLDASATGYGIDFGPLPYQEVHVVGSALIRWTGTAFSLFPLKLAVVIPAIWVLEIYRRDGNREFANLVLLAMITVGLAPGVRDMVRMVLHV